MTDNTVTSDPTAEAARPQSTKIAIQDLPSLLGKPIGVSPWTEITQERISLFADATDDHQWIHVDQERAKDGPFGTTIAHGYLTLSMASKFLLEGMFEVTGVSQVINIGLNKVRFTSPLPSGSRLRLVADCAAVDEVRGGYQVIINGTFEREGGDRPVCTAEILFRYYAG